MGTEGNCYLWMNEDAEGSDDEDDELKPKATLRGIVNKDICTDYDQNMI